MEKKYVLIEVNEGESGFTFEDTDVADDVKPVYCCDNKFKTYLLETALSQGKTDIEDKAEFDRNVEVYKILKEADYMGYDKVTIEASGLCETFNKDEIKLITAAQDKKIVDLNTVIEEIRNKIQEMHRESRIVVYTCITGGYDNLIKPSFVTPGIDYVCFTDNKLLKSDIWKIRPIPEELLSYSKVKQQRGVKILPHRYLPEYDISVWVDANMDTKGNVKTYLDGLDFDTYKVFIPEHPVRKCIYKEKDECVRIRKIKDDGIALANKQMARYRAEKFPENYGLVQSNIVIRKHNDPYSKELMETWWNELKDYSHRDQLSFNYALWKTGKEKFKYLIKTTCNSKTFNWLRKHKK